MNDEQILQTKVNLENISEYFCNLEYLKLTPVVKLFIFKFLLCSFFSIQFVLDRHRHL